MFLIGPAIELNLKRERGMTSPTPRSKVIPMEDKSSARFDINAIAKSLPETSDTMLVDHYMTNDPEVSTRVFRIYKPTPPHFHRHSDEYLYVVSGRGTFWMNTPEDSGEFGPGSLLFFKKTVVHALPVILEEPVVFLSIDVPRRIPTDIIFVNPEDGTPETFIRQQMY
jgi:mannose-6-phosphate isomerase-like protein (cupin superfamily)